MAQSLIRIQAPIALLREIDAIATHRTRESFGSRVTRSEIIRRACAEYVERESHRTRATRCTTPEE